MGRGRKKKVTKRIPIEEKRERTPRSREKRETEEKGKGVFLRFRKKLSLGREGFDIARRNGGRSN